MSVQTQIDRLAAAKAAIKSAIEGKGITVPDATTLDGFATLIEAIEAGGGLDTLFGHHWQYGTITPADDITSNYTIAFNQPFGDDVPAASNFSIFLWRDAPNVFNESSTPDGSWVWQVYGKKTTRATFGYGQYFSNTSGSTSNATYLGVVGTTSSGKSYTIYCTTSKKLAAGQTYNWIAVGVS